MFKYIITSITLVWLTLSTLVAPAGAQEKQIIFFYGDGCPHCSVVEDYFLKEGIYDRYPVVNKEIYFNRQNAQQFNQLLTQAGIPTDQQGVPAVVIGDQALIGDRPIIASFELVANEYLRAPPQTAATPATQEPAPPSSTDLTVLLVLGAALVDAINPCAFAVLIILMSTILVTGKSRRALYAGLAFASSIFISYFLMGLGLYTAIGISGFSQALLKGVGVLAIILGLLNLKDWLWYGKGFLMEVPMSWRPKLKQLLTSVTSPIGAFFIGFIVSLFLLPCTSGPYIVILGMLAEKSTQATAIAYLVLYNLIFVTPMISITILVYRGLKPEKLEKLRQKKLRLLHLIAGLILIAMGISLLAGWI